MRVYIKPLHLSFFFLDSSDDEESRYKNKESPRKP